MGCEGGAWAGTCDCWGGGAARAGGGAALMGGAEALGGEAALPLRGILNCVAVKMSQMKVAIQPNLELKTRPKQLLGSLPLVIALPGLG
jgi:hypothetical protein